MVASRTPPTGDLAHNPGIYPDRELNLQSFDSQTGTQPLSHTSQGWIRNFDPGSPVKKWVGAWVPGWGGTRVMREGLIWFLKRVETPKSEGVAKGLDS